jgi:hypothetical protein
MSIFAKKALISAAAFAAFAAGAVGTANADYFYPDMGHAYHEDRMGYVDRADHGWDRFGRDRFGDRGNIRHEEVLHRSERFRDPYTGFKR